MGKKKKILIPSYAEGFKCIGGRCEDSCCIGWDIDVDKKTFRKYAATKNSEMLEKFTEHIYINGDCRSKDIDYARIEIDRRRWCPFLDEDRLCCIQKTLGEDYLSNVCYTFPRAYNVLNGTFELSLYMSCPEAVRMLLSSSEPLTFTERTMPDMRHIINLKAEKSRLPDLRTKTVEILQDRSVPLKERLLNLGDYLCVPRGEITGEREAVRIEFYRYAIESLGVFEETDSPVFSEHTAFVMEEIREETAQAFRQILDRTVIPFFRDCEWAFEHYLVNMVYQDNFPHNQGGGVTDSYIMLAVRLGFLQYYLAGIALRAGTVTRENLERMIQVHSKIINHHKSFLQNLLLEIMRKRYDNREFVSLLID